MVALPGQTKLLHGSYSAYVPDVPHLWLKRSITVLENTQNIIRLHDFIRETDHGMMYIGKISLLGDRQFEETE